MLKGIIVKGQPALLCPICGEQYDWIREDKKGRPIFHCRKCHVSIFFIGLSDYRLRKAVKKAFKQYQKEVSNGEKDGS